MSNKSKTQLKGHALLFGGWGGYIRIDAFGELNIDQSPSVGFAICECWERSGILKSNTARKQWHREHKEAIRKA